MTDRVRTLTVHLEREFRDDDVQSVVTAIGMVKGVAKVDTVVCGPGEQMAIAGAKIDLKRELLQKLLDVLR